MSLLDFARGPALHWALIIFAAGVLWRLVGTLLMARQPDLSEPRIKNTFWGGLRTVATRSLPAKPFEKSVRFGHIAGYTWHIGYFVVLLLFTPHIAFLEGVVGFSWPGIPNDIVLVAGAVTLAVLIALLVRRMTHPVLRLISNADDYISWVATTLPLVMGLLAYAHIGLRYETMLALHLLSVELLMIWFPFGKLMHAVFVVPSRYQIGANYERRGVRA